jgi:hypothetical protein
MDSFSELTSLASTLAGQDLGEKRTKEKGGSEWPLEEFA